MKTVYLDNNATTQCLPEVVNAMLPYFSERYGNASSIYKLGMDAAKNVLASREKVALALGAKVTSSVACLPGSIL